MPHHVPLAHPWRPRRGLHPWPRSAVRTADSTRGHAQHPRRGFTRGSAARSLASRPHGPR
jgi:hypothetical protein